MIFDAYNIICNLEKDGIFEGWWWLPDKPEEKIPGIASFDGKRLIYLKIYGTFDIYKYNDKEDYPVILGQFNYESKISLINCNRVHYSSNLMKGMKSEYSVYQCREFIEKYHVRDFSELKINRVDLTFTNLTHWLCTMMNDDGTSLKNEIMQEISNVLFKDEVELSDNIKLELISHLAPSINSWTQKQTALKSYISLYCKEGNSLDYFKKIIAKLQTFFSFAMSGQSYPKDVKIFPSDCDHEKDSFIYNDYIKIKYVFPYRGDFNECKETLSGNMFFNYSTARNNIKEIFNNWIFESEKYGSSFDLYFSNLFNTSLYKEQNFINHIRAIEGLTRKLYDIKPVKNVEFNNFKNEVEELINKNQTTSVIKEKILARLESANHPSLTEYFQIILDKLSTNLKKQMFSDKVPLERFPFIIAKIRNKLQHQYDKEVKEYKNKELFYLYTNRIKIINEFLLLEITGLADENVDELLSKSIRTVYRIY